MDLTFQPNRTQEVETAKAHSVPNVTTTSHDPGMPARPNFASHPNPVIPQGLCPTRSGSLYPHIAHLGTNLVGLGDSNNEIVIIVMMYQFISFSSKCEPVFCEPNGPLASTSKPSSNSSQHLRLVTPPSGTQEYVPCHDESHLRTAQLKGRET